MGERKLVFLDIDGTLTVPGSFTPTRAVLDAVRSARERGHRVFICTGRNYGMTAAVLRYGFDGAVCSAGGYILCGDEVLYDHPMPNATRDELVSALHAGGAYCLLEARDDAYADDTLGEALGASTGGGSEVERWRRALVEDFGARSMGEYAGQPVYKAVFFCDRMEQVEPARAALEDRFNFCFQSFIGDGVLGETINRDFDKGRAILRLCEHLGVPQSDTVAFGDSMNDLEMIETAGVGVCMENGAAALKEKADMICPSVKEDGVAKGLVRLGLA